MQRVCSQVWSMSPPYQPSRRLPSSMAIPTRRPCRRPSAVSSVSVSNVLRSVFISIISELTQKYAREIYNNESIVMGTRQANKLINSCSLCGLCQTVCPEDFAMQDLCLQARRSMVGETKCHHQLTSLRCLIWPSARVNNLPWPGMNLSAQRVGMSFSGISALQLRTW